MVFKNIEYAAVGGGCKVFDPHCAAGGIVRGLLCNCGVRDFNFIDTTDVVSGDGAEDALRGD
jgi:hypothetical protein